jgi:hypothetical protein
MTTIEKQVLETWFINHRTNLMLIDALTEEALSFTTSKRGGGTIGHQLAHIYNIRFWKLEKYDKALVQNLTTIRAEDIKTLKMLKNCHTVSAHLIGDSVRKGSATGRTDQRI